MQKYFLSGLFNLVYFTICFIIHLVILPFGIFMSEDKNYLSNIFQALSDETRRAILEKLREGPAKVGELAKLFTLSAPAISKHIAILENSGLIFRTIDKQARICTLNNHAFIRIDQYLAIYRRVLNQRLEKLENVFVE